MFTAIGMRQYYTVATALLDKFTQYNVQFLIL